MLKYSGKLLSLKTQTEKKNNNISSTALFPVLQVSWQKNFGASWEIPISQACHWNYTIAYVSATDAVILSFVRCTLCVITVVIFEQESN